VNLFNKQTQSFAPKSFSKSVFRKNTLKLIGTLFLAFGTWNFTDRIVTAETAQNIPEELAEIVTEIDTAANEQDLEELMEHYDAKFTNEDGLTVDSVKATLEKTWSTYPDLTYKTTINSATQKGDELIAETATIITGSQNSQGRVVKLESKIKSRQYFRDQKLVRQEIITEETKLTAGDRPPQIQVNVPETVKLGEKYNFDTIVTEPLEGNVLLGAAIEERIGSNLYLNPSTIELEPLSAGGIFKVVTAPRLKDNHWLSAIIVRGDGITMVTKRVRIQE
jgi:hypothetical protein